MLNKQIYSVIAIVLTFIAFYPYIKLIIRGVVHPYVFSWIIWSSTTLVVFLAQLEEGGGVGAWPIGVSACITLLIAYLSYLKCKNISITRMDWLFFISAMSSLPFWYFTSDPLWAVVVLTIVDVLGFGPTYRKAYAFPHAESVVFYSIFGVRNILVIMALENYSMTTVLFPAAIGCMSVILAAVIYQRRVISLT